MVIEDFHSVAVMPYAWHVQDNNLLTSSLNSSILCHKTILFLFVVRTVLLMTPRDYYGSKVALTL